MSTEQTPYPPAFPVHMSCPDKGMDLLDYFAAKAIPLVEWGQFGTQYSLNAKKCYQIAESMLKARSELNSK